MKIQFFIHFNGIDNTCDCRLKTLRFCRAYRMPKFLVNQLIEKIRPFARGIGSVPLHLQVLSVLNFYATGGYQM